MPAPFGQPPRRSLGVSGTVCPAPSPSLDPAAIENIEPKDSVRHEAAAALALGRSCGEVACKTSREIHADQTLRRGMIRASGSPRRSLRWKPHGRKF
jgi:hypothetical protein